MLDEQLNKFNCGDLVILASNPHVLMTVQGVVSIAASNATGISPGVHCSWLDHYNNLCEGVFHPLSLLHEQKVGE